MYLCYHYSCYHYSCYHYNVRDLPFCYSSSVFGRGMGSLRTLITRCIRA